jgi:cholesterol transport system auxiliary component
MRPPLAMPVMTVPVVAVAEARLHDDRRAVAITVPIVGNGDAAAKGEHGKYCKRDGFHAGWSRGLAASFARFCYQTFPVLAAAILAGCSSSADVSPRSYDFGFAPSAVKFPPLRAIAVRAPMPFDGVEMQYRLAYRDTVELASFAHSRWAAPPAELLRKQLLRAVPEAFSGPCALDLEIQEFSQVFSAKDASEARIELRASVTSAKGGDSRAFSVAEPNAGATSATGAAALARASERVLAEIASWVSAQGHCRK